MNKLHVMFGIMLIIFSIPSAMAISVNGVRGAGEWDENWAFGQDQGTGYDPLGPFGDKMVIFQNGLWYDVDPMRDSGTLFNEDMATEDTMGTNFSGYDLMGFYARYDPVGDVLYGMSTVYGMPGDLDGDGAIDSRVANGDTAGPVTGEPIEGIGIGEQFSITVEHNSKDALILVSGNEVKVTDLGGNPISVTAFAANEPAAPAPTVYEIAITGLADYLGLAPGESFSVKVIAGGNLDIPGEDQAQIFIDIPNPEIDIEKATNGVDADSPTGPVLGLGDIVTWTYVVTNTGDVPLENVVVTDNKEGVISDITDKGNGDDILDVGEEWTYEETGTAECGQYANDADVVGFYGVIPVTDEDPSHYIVRCRPEIGIEKHTNGQDADFPQGPQIEVGETITWEYFVTNTGNVPLINIVVVDDHLGVIPDANIVDKGNGDDILAVGETWTYVVTDTLQECIPQYKNIADVTGEDEQGTDVTDSDPSHFHCQPIVPVLTPIGIMGLIGSLGILGIVTLRRRD
ncbi:hypothetical protein V7O66_06055 [Methanolobus sp. ZRKC3]|uniref:DUF7507 domain-containing protein n=1 Tax=Methanolobus sp. ZRKC3 TaxID=3125786 RepID=UPI00324D02B1